MREGRSSFVHKNTVFTIRPSFVNITRVNMGGFVNKTMRPLKYKNLGEMSIMRIPSTTSKVIVRLNEVMQRIEESGEDSIDIIMNTLDELEDKLR